MHKPLDALILDKDGVIFDSERIYAETAIARIYDQVRVGDRVFVCN